MARSHRKSATTVKDVLLKEPYRFEFHQAVKLLEYLHPEAAPFGEAGTLTSEVVVVKSRIYWKADRKGKSSSMSSILILWGLRGFRDLFPIPIQKCSSNGCEVETRA